MMELLDTTQRLIEKWKEFELPGRGRYPVLIIIPNSRSLFDNSVIDEFGNIAGAEIFDFEKLYTDELNSFFTRNRIRTEIVRKARNHFSIVLNVEYFYDKWTSAERISFLKDMIRQDGHKGIILILYCEEDMSSVIAIPENDRGVIWNP